MKRFIALSLLLGGFVPGMAFLKSSTPSTHKTVAQASWPQTFEGRPLKQLKLSAREKAFERGFPGRIGRFTDGARELIIRHIHAPTRSLHPGHHCFRGLGYAISFSDMHVDEKGDLWSSFSATKTSQEFAVRERIVDLGSTQSWTDVSAWYWSALLQKTKGPWLAITVANNTNSRYRYRDLKPFRITQF